MSQYWGAGHNADDQERLDRMYAAEEQSIELDEIEVDNAARDIANRKGQKCIDAMQEGLAAIYAAGAGGKDIADHERREDRERRRDYAD